MIQNYCQEEEDCIRKVLFEAGKKPSSNDLMPVGIHALKGFLSRPSLNIHFCDAAARNKPEPTNAPPNSLLNSPGT